MAAPTPRGLLGSMTIAALSVIAVPSAAQEIHFTPFAGAYYSASTLANVETTSGPIEVVQASGVALGATLDVPLSPKFGIEVTGSFALTDPRIQATVQTAGNPDVKLFTDLDGWMTHASVTGRINATQTGNFFVFGGPGISFRGGDAWEGLDGSDAMAFGGTLGLGVLARVAPGFTLDIRAETFIYSFDPDGSDIQFDSTVNADILVKLGVRLPGR